MENLEIKALRTSDVKPKIYKRFVDDTIAAIKTTKINDFHGHLNAQNPHIQFTIERYHPDGLAYLDTLNEVREDGCIDISVYRKPTHTDKYLHFDSLQPIHHKAAVAKSLYSRAAKVSSSPLNKRLEVEHINRVLESNGYPKEFLKKQRRSVFETNPREDRSPGGDDDHDQKGLIILPYIRSVTGLVENAGTRICGYADMRVCGYAGTSNWFNKQISKTH